MKKIAITMSILLTALLITGKAMAFISVIDITTPWGETTTITNAESVDLSELEGNLLTYRGIPSEAVSLFKKLVISEFRGLAHIESELNQETQTLSITVLVQGFAGYTRHYFIIKKAGN